MGHLRLEDACRQALLSRVPILPPPKEPFCRLTSEIRLPLAAANKLQNVAAHRALNSGFKGGLPQSKRAVPAGDKNYRRGGTVLEFINFS